MRLRRYLWCVRGCCIVISECAGQFAEDGCDDAGDDAGRGDQRRTDVGMHGAHPFDEDLRIDSQGQSRVRRPCLGLVVREKEDVI